MTTIKVPATYKNGIFEPIKPIKDFNSKNMNFFVTIEYSEEKKDEIYEQKKDGFFYKNIEYSLNKVWENDETTYSLSDIKNV